MGWVLWGGPYRMGSVGCLVAPRSLAWICGAGGVQAVGFDGKDVWGPLGWICGVDLWGALGSVGWDLWGAHCSLLSCASVCGVHAVLTWGAELWGRAMRSVGQSCGAWGRAMGQLWGLWGRAVGNCCSPWALWGGSVGQRGLAAVGPVVGLLVVGWSCGAERCFWGRGCWGGAMVTYGAACPTLMGRDGGPAQGLPAVGLKEWGWGREGAEVVMGLVGDPWGGCGAGSGLWGW